MTDLNSQIDQYVSTLVVPKNPLVQEITELVWQLGASIGVEPVVVLTGHAEGFTYNFGLRTQGKQVALCSLTLIEMPPPHNAFLSDKVDNLPASIKSFWKILNKSPVRIELTLLRQMATGVPRIP